MEAKNKISEYCLIWIIAFALFSNIAVNAEEGIYYYIIPDHYQETGGFDQEQASIVLSKINGTEEEMFVTSEKSYSTLIYMHPYSVGAFDPSTAEWVVIISSIPENTTEIKISIFRLDYQTYNLKAAYKFSYPVGTEISLEESIAIMEEEMNKDRYHNPVAKEKIVIKDGFYIYTYPAMDFGGTIIVNKYAGRAIFYATTVWDGGGQLIIPSKEIGITPSNTSEYYGTPDQTNQTSPKLSGFGVLFGIAGLLAVWWELKLKV